MAYTPGVARVCMAIAEDPDKAFQYTIKRNTVAVVSDGTAVLGLGDIGPEAAMPVMEGKAMLFKEFAGVDAFPICLDTKDPDEIVETVAAHRAGLRRHQPRGHLRAALLRDRGPPEGAARHPGLPRRPARHRGRRPRRAAQRLQAHRPRARRACACSSPASAPPGVAVTKILMEAGVRDIVGADSKGLVSTERADYARRLDERDQALVRRDAPTPTRSPARPADALEGADLFIGLSGARIFPAEALRRMNDDAMVFAMANPTPEVSPEEAAPYARIVATGRSDYPNQINNVLCFPGIFRGALDVRARAITEEMKMAAARAIAGSSPSTSCARTTSSRRSSTATSRPPWPPRWPSRPRSRAPRRPPATRSASRRSTPSGCARPEPLVPRRRGGVPQP